MENDKESRQFSLLMCLIFVATAAPLMVHHEMWRDELQTWLLIRDVNSFWGLFSYLRNELHPFLWYVLVYPLKFVARNPEIMKSLHLLIASVTVYIFCRNAPFSRLNKLLFIFGYFPFFEYGIITRNYSLVLLFSVFLAAVYMHKGTVLHDSKAKLFGLTIGLFLICQTHIFGVLIGGVFAFLLGWDVFLKREKIKLLPLIGFLSGVALFIVQIWPMNNWQTAAFGIWRGLDRMLIVVQSVWRGFFPLPMPRLHFWNTSILDISTPLVNVQYLLGLFTLLGSIVFIATLRERRSMLFYGIGTFLCLILIFLTSYYLPIRFHGFIFIFFMLSIWIGYALKGNVCKSKVFSLLLIVHVVATSVAYYYDMRYPFSASKRAAAHIRTLGYQESLIVGYRATRVSSVAAYLDSQIYYPQADRFGSFSNWDWTRFVSLDTCEILKKAKELRTSSKKPVVVVLNYLPKKEERMCDFESSLVLSGRFLTSIVPTEIYSIWIMR